MINVIIPAYNCTKTLDKTLSSLVAQTDSDFIVILVDDCSTEDIKSIVDTYTDKLNITYIRNEENLGCGMSRQVGIDNADCSHFTFLDSDDMFMPYTVETFNSIVKANPDTEYIHSYFYEQRTIHGNPALILHENNYDLCHGKLYSKKKVDEFGIKNSPLVKYADDSFFNSMCTELFDCQVIGIPTVLWCNNPNSIIRRHNPERDKILKEDFLNAIKMSRDFVLQYKDSVEHLGRTINRFIEVNSINEKETELLENLKEI